MAAEDWMVSTLRRLLALLMLCVAAAAHGQERFFDSGGVKIRFIDRGEGEPVVLIHGFSRDVELTWGEPGIVDLLAERCRVIALDCRGHGASDRPSGDDAYGGAMVEDVVRLLDHLQIEQARLVGYSMGGRIALKLAATHPQRVRSVLLIGAGGLRAEDDHRLWDEVAAALEAGDGIAPLVRHIAPQLPEEQVRAINDETLSRNDAAALAAVARNYRAFATSDEEIEQLAVPIHAVIGANDPFRREVEALRARLHEMDVVVIADADHVSTLSRAELFAALRAFLREGAEPDRR